MKTEFHNTEPEYQKIKKELINAADHTRKTYLNYPHSVFEDIVHYMNSKNRELGYIIFPNSSHEGIILFESPRIWAQEFLNRSKQYANYGKDIA